MSLAARNFMGMGLGGVFGRQDLDNMGYHWTIWRIVAVKDCCMNQIKSLIKEWEAQSKTKPLEKEVTVKVTAYDYARIHALVDLFSGRTQEQLVSELLAAALDEVEVALPYIPGKKVISEDELGDPICEDIGLTPRFVTLTRKYSGS